MQAVSKSLWIVAHLSPLPPSSPHLVSTAHSGKANSITLCSWHKNTEQCWTPRGSVCDQLSWFCFELQTTWAEMEESLWEGFLCCVRPLVSVWFSPFGFVRRLNWCLCIMFRQFEVRFGGLEEMFWPGIWGDWLAYVQIHGTLSVPCVSVNGLLAVKSEFLYFCSDEL